MTGIELLIILTNIFEKFVSTTSNWKHGPQYQHQELLFILKVLLQINSTFKIKNLKDALLHL